MNIWKYSSEETSETFPFGKMKIQPPITEEDLGLASLNVVEFEVLADEVFLLDKEFGLVTFRYVFNQQSGYGEV